MKFKRTIYKKQKNEDYGAIAYQQYSTEKSKEEEEKEEEGDHWNQGCKKLTET